MFQPVVMVGFEEPTTGTVPSIEHNLDATSRRFYDVQSSLGCVRSDAARQTFFFKTGAVLN